MTLVTITCTFCGGAALPDYPHRHDAPLRPDYNPMPPFRDDIGYLIQALRQGWLDEIPVALHVSYVPGRAEPIGVSEYSASAAGYVAASVTVDSLDTGSLGSPSWSPSFHHRAGGITGIDGEWTLDARDYATMPWAYAVEVVLQNWCRSRHLTRPSDYPEHGDRTLCYELVKRMVVGFTLADASEACEVERDRVRWLLVHRDKRDRPAGALSLVWRVVSDRLNGIDLRRRVA